MNIVKSIFILVATLSLVTMSTGAVFTSRVSVVGNEFSTGTFPAPTPTDTDKKVDICHRDNGKEPYHIIPISINALDAHLAHGDIYPVSPEGCPTSLISGLSVEVSPTPSPLPSPSISPTPTETPAKTPPPVPSESPSVPE